MRQHMGKCVINFSVLHRQNSLDLSLEVISLGKLFIDTLNWVRSPCSGNTAPCAFCLHSSHCVEINRQFPLLPSQSYKSSWGQKMYQSFMSLFLCHLAHSCCQIQNWCSFNFLNGYMNLWEDQQEFSNLFCVIAICLMVLTKDLWQHFQIFGP